MHRLTINQVELDSEQKCFEYPWVTGEQLSTGTLHFTLLIALAQNSAKTSCALLERILSPFLFVKSLGGELREWNPCA